MPTTAVGLYKVVLEQEYLNQIVLNTFYFQNALDTDDLQEECSHAFDLDLLPTIATIQSTSVVYQNIRVENVTGSLADFNLTPTTAAGGVAGLVAASFIACTIRLNRTTKETRNGSKRFAGMVEENMNGQTFLGAYVVTLDALAVVLAGTIDDPGGIFRPVIARAPVDPEVLWTINDVASGTASSDVKSQVSRRKGKGI